MTTFRARWAAAAIAAFVWAACNGGSSARTDGGDAADAPEAADEAGATEADDEGEAESGETAGEAGEDAGDAPEDGDAATAFAAPTWWHHYHADSQNTDHNRGLVGPRDLERRWTWPTDGTRVASFDGASLSADQGTLYVTSSFDDRDNLWAIDTASGTSRWSYGLDAWATWSAALVDNDDTIYVADKGFAYALEAPVDEGEAPRWRVAHDQVSMSLGFTPWGEVFEVTIEGEVSVYRRDGTDETALLARTRLVRDTADLPLPLGAGLPSLLQDNANIKDAAYPEHDPLERRRVPCRRVTDFTDDAEDLFLAPGHIAYCWDKFREQELLASAATLAERFFDTAFGGTFCSNTPSIARVGASTARIFVPTVGTFHPPDLDDPRLTQYTDQVLKDLFFPFEEEGTAAEWAAKVRPTAVDPSGRYAIDPDVDDVCHRIEGSEDPVDVQPYLYPAFGTPRAVIDVTVLATLTEGTREYWQERESIKSDYRKLTHGYYDGYLQVVDWNHATRELTVRNPIPTVSPSGTSPAITDAEARSDGRRLVVFAAGPRLYALDIGTDDEPPTIADLQWTWNAGLPVGGSPAAFRPEDVGQPAGSGPAVAVLSGFRGVSMVQDRPAADCDPAEHECCGPLLDEDGHDVPGTANRCVVLYDANPRPFDEREAGHTDTRAERYYAGEPITLDVGTSVVEAADRTYYVAFTEGPAHDEFFEAHGIGNWEDFIPLGSTFAVVDAATGEIIDSEPLDAAPVCDSTIGANGWVYAIHTAGLDQIKHVVYPAVFETPVGGVVAFTAP